jgi:hypothetical protein
VLKLDEAEKEMLLIPVPGKMVRLPRDRTVRQLLASKLRTKGVMKEKEASDVMVAGDECSRYSDIAGDLASVTHGTVFAIGRGWLPREQRWTLRM